MKEQKYFSNDDFSDDDIRDYVVDAAAGAVMNKKQALIDAVAKIDSKLRLRIDKAAKVLEAETEESYKRFMKTDVGKEIARTLKDPVKGKELLNLMKKELTPEAVEHMAMERLAVISRTTTTTSMG